MTNRQPIKRTPTGSPAASPVRVSLAPKGWVPYQTPWEASVTFLRVEEAWPAAKQDSPGRSIEQYVGTAWAKNPNGSRTNPTQDGDPSGGENR